MKSVKFTLKVITPLFMGGGNQEAELRGQSIKGMIRFWYRALKAENDIKKLKEEEVKIFGGQIKNKQNELEAISSKIKISIIKNNISVGSDLKVDYRLNSTYNPQTRNITGVDAGLSYLLYSTIQTSRNYIKDGSTFSLVLSSLDENALKQTLAAFWCSIYLGGFGTRSRRGAGNLIIEDVPGDTFNLNFKPSGNDLNDWFKTNIRRCFELIGGKPRNPCYAYSNLSLAKIILSKEGFNDWKSALNSIGQKFHNFRYQNKSRIFETASFGLPIRHSNGNVVNLVKIDNHRRTNLRRASPLVIKIIKFNNNFYWTVLYFSGEFNPRNYIICDRSEERQINLNLINDFIRSLLTFGTSLEVNLC